MKLDSGNRTFDSGASTIYVPVGGVASLSWVRSQVSHSYLRVSLYKTEVDVVFLLSAANDSKVQLRISQKTEMSFLSNSYHMPGSRFWAVASSSAHSTGTAITPKFCPAEKRCFHLALSNLPDTPKFYILAAAMWWAMTDSLWGYSKSPLLSFTCQFYTQHVVSTVSIFLAFIGIETYPLPFPFLTLFWAVLLERFNVTCYLITWKGIVAS